MNKWGYIQLALSLLVMFTYGCTVLGPVTDRSRFYILSSDSAVPSRSSIGRTDLTIGLGPVQIPQYLERAGLATRIGTTRIEYSSTDRWAEPLNECFPRILSQDLSHDLGTDRVMLFPWNRSLGVNYQVQVDVERFDIVSGNDAELNARWLIKDPSSGRILHSGYSNQIRAAGIDGASRTEALSRTVNGLSMDIASEVQRLAERKSFDVPA